MAPSPQNAEDAASMLREDDTDMPTRGCGAVERA